MFPGGCPPTAIRFVRFARLVIYNGPVRRLFHRTRLGAAGQSAASRILRSEDFPLICRMIVDSVKFPRSID